MLFNKIYCKAFALATFLSFCTHQAYSQVSNFGYSLKPIKMSFLGTGIVPIKDDNNTKFYDAPHWTENQAAPFIPVCYVSGSTPKVNCLFQITGTCTNAIYVKGQASNGMLFPQQQLTINTAGALYPVIDASAAFAFGQADIFENFTVDWYMTNNPSGGSWVNVGTSTNVMYVTKATPLSILSTREDINQLGGTRLGDTNCPTFHTTLHIGCQYGKGLTTDLSLIDGVYDYFKGKNVQSIEKDSVCNIGEILMGTHKMLRLYLTIV